MKYNLHIKEVLKKISKHSKTLQDTQLMHPEREWGIGLLVACIFFIAAASLSAYTYFKNQSVDVYVGSTETEDVVYRESLVKEALERIENRARKIEELSGQIQEVTVPPKTETATSSAPAVVADPEVDVPSMSIE